MGALLHRGSSLLAAALLSFALAEACTGQMGAGAALGSGASGGSAGMPTDVAGGCDITKVFSKPENGCTNSNCHGKPFQGGLDLATPGVADRLVGVRSTSDACSGQLLIDPKNPDDSLLLRLVDAQRFAANPGCGVMMPFGKPEGLTGDDLTCVENWVHAVAGTDMDAGTPVQPFEPLVVESYLQKVKTLLNGGAVNADELTAVQKDPSALKGLVTGWTQAPEFQTKMHDFLAVALQQRVVGTLDFQLDTLRGPFRASLTSNAEESFLRTTLDTISAHRPFTEVVTTQHFAVTTGLLVAIAYTDKTDAELKADKQTLYRAPPDGTPAAPWTLDYELANKQWLLPTLPATGCDKVTLTGPGIYDMLMGSVRCPLPLGPTNITSGTVLSDADFADWHFIDIKPATAKNPPTKFYDVASLRTATTVYLKQPRIGFFTTPAFFANWDTNDGNQFRVTTSQTLITALGEILSPADPTKPVSEDGLDAAHAPTTSSCYGCHQFLDPMRGYFSSTFSTTYKATDTPTTSTPSFAFHGVTHEGGDLAAFANTLATHPLFASAWVQKLCFYANSEGCEASDPEVQRIAQVFTDSHFDFVTLVQELFTSPLVTGVSATQSFTDQDYLVSITRRQHFCQMIDERLGTTDTCKNAGTVVGLIPQDEFSRGSAVPVQPAVTSLFHFAAAEKLCGKIAGKLVGTGLRFDPANAPAAIDDLVSALMGLSSAHSRAAAMHDALSKHFADARSAGASTLGALKDTFTVACMSPDVMGLGL